MFAHSLTDGMTKIQIGYNQRSASPTFEHTGHVLISTQTSAKLKTTKITHTRWSSCKITYLLIFIKDRKYYTNVYIYQNKIMLLACLLLL